ncbi:MAG: septum formation initiator family protein [Patescibacteria group bacterium]|nr:septum formation initiator family protein [Patescibacteria group bacterium]
MIYNNFFSRIKRITVVIIFFVGFFTFIHSSLSIYKLLQRNEYVFQQEKRLKELQGIQNELKKQLSDSYTEFFIEQQARNVLGLGKDNEIIVFREKISEDKKEEMNQYVVKQDQIFMRWWNLFFTK